MSVIDCLFIGTRWTDRVASVRPFAAHLPGLREALEELLDLNLTPKTDGDVKSCKTYMSSFICILMASIWLKVLVQIDRVNQIIQARNATIDVEISNINQLIVNLKELRGKW